MKSSPITAGFLTLASHHAVLAGAAECECGYTVNKTSNSQFALFTDYYESDFLHVATSGNGSMLFPWLRQEANISAEESRSFGMWAQLANVKYNFLDDGEWESGEPVEPAADAGTQLLVRHELKDNLVPVAWIASPPGDIVYGSFRAAIKFTGVNGTCGRFHWRNNNRTQTIEIDFLSKDPKTLHLDVSSGDSNDTNASSSTTAWSSTNDFPQGFHEYRFDWMPDHVDFYVDSLLVWTTTKNIPDSPGHLMLSHWSDGNPDGSGGPPMEDAVMTVTYVKAYFNTTASYSEPKPECRVLNADDVCVVPDQTSPPEPQGKTHFYSKWHEEHEDDEGDSTFVASGSDAELDAKSDHSSAASFDVSSLVWYFVGAVCSIVYCLA